jgi:hypothetical protein
VRVADGARITLRTETFVNEDARKLDVRSRFEKRTSSGAIVREDASHARTWYEESDIAALLADAGYADIVIEPSARPSESETRFAVRARAAS